MRKIILASASPRRCEILEKLGIPFSKKPSSFDESLVQLNDPIELVKTLSFRKAMNVLEGCSEEVLIIGADTVVTFQGIVLGKPKDEQQAFDYLKMLSGNSHDVYSGIAIIDENNHHYIHYDHTRVTMHQMEDYAIKRYIETKEPLDKAGAYGIQGIGATFVRKIDGDYFNVMGLPISKLIEGLAHHGVDYFSTLL